MSNNECFPEFVQAIDNQLYNLVRDQVFNCYNESLTEKHDILIDVTRQTRVLIFTPMKEQVWGSL